MFSKFCLLLLAIVGASCTHNINVVDEAGTPIEGAKVYPMARAFHYPAIVTDSKGSVLVRQTLPTVEHIQVSAKGYQNSPLTSYDLPKPITVVLRK